MRLTGKKLRLLGLAAAVTAIVGLFVATQAWAGAVTGTLGVESAEIAPGDRETVTVFAEVPEPGLGAWTVDVMVEDPDQVTIIDCDVPTHSVCNPDYPGDLPTVRFAGAVAEGLVGDDIEIGTITIECADEEGSSVLSLSTAGFADATIGGPVEIAVTESPGTISCTEEAARPTRRPSEEDTPTPSVSGLPPTGSGSSNSAFGGYLAALAAAALAGVAGYSVLRMRSRP
jgi:hypothetical protein